MTTTTRFVSAVAAAVVYASIAACASGGSSRPAPPRTDTPQPEPRSPIEGEWRLTALRLADGSARRVTGYLRVDRFSTITVHAELAPDEVGARPPRTVVVNFTARTAVGAGVLEYTALAVGVGAERLTEDAVPMGEWRHFDVTGDTLRLSAHDRSGRAAATLVFDRAP